MADKLLEYKCIGGKQLRILLLKGWKRNENYERDRKKIQKFDYIRSSLAETSTIKTPKRQTHILIPREASVIFFSNSYLDSNFDWSKKLIFPDIQRVMVYDWFIWDLLLYSLILNWQRAVESTFKIIAILT